VQMYDLCNPGLGLTKHFTVGMYMNHALERTQKGIVYPHQHIIHNLVPDGVQACQPGTELLTKR